MMIYLYLWMISGFVAAMALVGLDIVCVAAVILAIYLIYKIIYELKSKKSNALSMLIGIIIGLGCILLFFVMLDRFGMSQTDINLFAKYLMIISLTIFITMLIYLLIKKYVPIRCIIYTSTLISLLPILIDAYAIWFLIDRNW